MQTRPIPEDQWLEYIDRFSRDHVGCAVTIEVLDMEMGPQHLAVDLPLEGISFDTKGTRPSSIEISAGDRPDRHISHLIDMPLHIREAEEPNGNVAVQIEPARGPVTLLHVRGPLH
jgi:hypothetical protein